MKKPANWDDFAAADYLEMRNAIIEECARVAEAAVMGTWPSDIADAIRALKKEKP